MKTSLSSLLVASICMLLAFGCKPKPEPEIEQVEYILSVSPKSLTLLLGETAKLHPSITPAYETTFTYKSEDTDVATVDKNGVVTASSDSTGSTTILIFATINGEERKTRCMVSVVEDKPVLNKDSIALFIGDEQQLTVAYSLSETDVTDECTWQSDNTSVATCSGGLVHAVGAGTTHLTVTYDTITLTCTIRVFDNLAITPDEVTLLVGATTQLTANLPKATFSSNDEGVARVSAAGLVTAVSKGTATITAQYAGKSATATVNVSDDLQILKDGQQVSSLTVLQDCQVQLTTNAPGAVQWSSDNTSIAQVNTSGIVSGISIGTCAVTAQFGTLSASVTINVKENKRGFYVSETQQVEIAPGNLQYNLDTYHWRFAPNPWDICGKDNELIDTHNDVWIDLFGNMTGKTPTNYSVVESDYPSYNQHDWGVNKIQRGTETDSADTWQSLKPSEWNYILYNRPDASSLMSTATVEGVSGLVLLPAGWEKPSGIAIQTGLGSCSRNVYTAAQWKLMQAAGAVFMPQAGNRQGKDYRGGVGSYWIAYDYTIAFYDTYLNVDFSDFNSPGLSVRLGRYISD